MNFPALPATDSLYKFVTLVGVMLGVIGILYPLTKEQELSLRLVQVNGEVARYNIAVGHLKEDLAEARSVLANPIALNKNEVASRVQREDRDLQLQLAGINEKKAELDELGRQLMTWRTLGQFGVWIGVMLALTGFALWYRRVQRWQDCALRQNLKG